MTHIGFLVRFGAFLFAPQPPLAPVAEPRDSMRCHAADCAFGVWRNPPAPSPTETPFAPSASQATAPVSTPWMPALGCAHQAADGLTTIVLRLY